MCENEFVFDLIHETTGCICIKCNKLYYPYHDPFIVIKTTKYITFEFCKECLKIFNKCEMCQRFFNEPWDIVYTDNNFNSMKCKCCFNRLSNKKYKCLLLTCKNCYK